MAALLGDGALWLPGQGAVSLLSPCGAEYLPRAQRRPRRVPFAPLEHREQLLQALDFRNTFASRPYLPSHVIPPERKKNFQPFDKVLKLALDADYGLMVLSVFRDRIAGRWYSAQSDILEVKWPDPATADLTRCIENGIVKISSIDGYAHLYLSELQQEFTVEFLCKVSQSSATSLCSSQNNSNYRTGDQNGKSNKNSVTEMSSKQMRVENKKNEHGCAEGQYREPTKQKDQKDRDGVPVFYTNCSYEYTWVRQRWSVSSYPEEWKYPLLLAQICCNLHAAKDVMKACEKDNHTSIGTDVLIDLEKYRTFSRLPTALPLSCRAPHLHRWTFCDFFQNQDTEVYACPQLIQIVWCQGVLYRFIHGRRNIAEIYPGDDSFFKSEGALLGNYFVHYAIQKGTRKREEKMYSVKSLPPDVPGNPYSIASIITQATKILQYCYKTKLSLSPNYYFCCWKMVPETDGREMLPVLLYKKLFPSTGRLFVYSDHKVHAAFWDGMTLNMVWEFDSSCNKIQVNEDMGWCKLTTPDGVQQLIQISHPGIYERYIRTAIEWCRSLNERKEIPEYTAHSVTEENWSADAELEKIQRFNLVLLDSSNVLERTSAAKNNPSGVTVRKTENGSELEEIGEVSILEALEKTSKAIQDIESLLAASRK